MNYAYTLNDIFWVIYDRLATFTIMGPDVLVVLGPKVTKEQTVQGPPARGRPPLLDRQSYKVSTNKWQIL
jgi:hypothetical protein